MASLKLNRPKNTPRKPQRVMKMRGTTSMTSTNIPIEKAYTIKQTSRGPSRHVETSSEIIGSIAMLPDQPAGQVFEFLLSPTNMPGTRLNAISRNFQKYRFTRAALLLASTLPTSVGGSLTTGYTNEPAEGFPQGGQNKVFQLPNAEISTLYTPTRIVADFSSNLSGVKRDKTEFFISQESGEENTEIQGKFVIENNSQITTNGTVNIPVILEYTCEMWGAAGNEPAQAQVWPSSSITSGSNGAMLLAIAVGETATFPSLVTGLLYELQPSISAKVAAGGIDAGSTNLNYVSYAGTTLTFKFWNSIKEFRDNTPIQSLAVLADAGGSLNRSLGRSTVSLVQDVGN